jgi:hypothetical protein
MSPGVLAIFDRLVTQPHGIVLVTGPTGSGKSTTPYAMLSRLDAAATNIMTVEYPIEYDVPGVGQTQQFGAEYSMRIWLNPDKLRSFRMSAADVLAKVRGQNVQFATGSLGEQPAVEGQQVVAPVSAEAQFSSKEEFENVILRTEANGTSVRLKDVARVELGLNSYSFDVRLDNQPVAGFGTAGVVDLKQGIMINGKQADLEKSEIGLHSTPTVVNDTILVGSSMFEGLGYEYATNVQGQARAFDARTGKQL